MTTPQLLLRSPSGRLASPQQQPRLRQAQAGFADGGHLAFYAAPRRSRSAAPVAAAAAPSRRARVLQTLADVEETLMRLEQVRLVAGLWCRARAHAPQLHKRCCPA